MDYSSIGVSGFDLLFMNDAEREVFYERIPLITPREVKTITTTLLLNKKAVASLNLSKNKNTGEFREAYAEMQSFKQRFFKGSQKQDVLDDFSFDSFEEDGGTTNEFVKNKEDATYLLEELSEEIEQEVDQLEELEIFIRAGGVSKEVKSLVDKKVMENNFRIVKSRYDMIPLDTSELASNKALNNKFVMQAIASISKRSGLCDVIVMQLQSEGSRNVIDATVRGKLHSSSQRTGVYKRFSEKKKNIDEIGHALNQIARQLTDVPTGDLDEVAPENVEVSELYDQIHYRLDNVTATEPEKRHRLQAIQSLTPLYRVLKEVQMREFKEVFGSHQPDVNDVITCSEILAKELSITGLLPEQEITLLKSASAFSFKQRSVSPTPEVAFVLRILTMSLISEKYDMVMGVSGR